MKTTIALMSLFAISIPAFAQNNNNFPAENVVCSTNSKSVTKCKEINELRHHTHERSHVYKYKENGITSYSDNAPKSKYEKIDLDSEKMKDKLSVYPSSRPLEVVNINWPK